MATNDRIRTSDADRERVTARLREHFAEGRLTREELDERVTTALNAKTFGELRRVLADLPEPVPVLPDGRRPRAAWSGPAPVFRRRGPRLFPLVALLLILAVVLPGAGWAILQVLLVMMLVTILGGIFAAARFRRRMREHWQAHQEFWGDQGWNGPGWHGPGGGGPGGRRGPGQVDSGWGGPGDDEAGDDEPGGSWGWPGGHWQHHARYWAGPATPPYQAG
ncbi:MAG TPA: DUF1707 domain-containing protein [Streptosporangiaceae bacterium]|jgi:hypothetical protein|nr:DUF1707 domain-containing protein [Streptosporangiaceae bacterium]